MSKFINKIKSEVEEELKASSTTNFADIMLSRYFTLKGNIAIVQLNFDTFSELVDQSIGDDRVEKLNSDLIEKIAGIFELIPRKYKIEVEIHIKDFGNYELSEAERILRQNFALLIYSFSLERRRKIITGISLLGGGVALLLVSYFLGKLELPQILFDVINISGTLLVWEAANVTLIERSADKKRMRRFLSKFSDLRLVNG